MPTIEEVEVRYGLTQNVGDYSNVKPEVVIRAKLQEGEKIEDALKTLTDVAQREIYRLADDGLEAHGLGAKYERNLFDVRRNEVRKCWVVVPANTELPKEKTWRDGDLSKLPPLPDPGPEPLWHQKSLKYGLDKLFSIDESEWDSLAELEYVTDTYLRELYNNRYDLNLEYRESAAMVAYIRENPTVKEVPALIHDEEDDDYDEDED